MIIFYIVFTFNILQYFNIFNFNQVIEIFYTSPERILFFGKNSLGEIDTKRLLGTMGNPNNNAILFLFFAAVFAPMPKNNKSRLIIFCLSFLAILLTQSRTGLIAFICMVIINIVIFKLGYKHIFRQLAFFVLIFIFINAVEYIEFNIQGPLTNGEMKEFTFKKDILKKRGLMPATRYLTNIIEDDISERSISGRIEIWQRLWVL
jgi:hypothetical protein